MYPLACQIYPFSFLYTNAAANACINSNLYIFDRNALLYDVFLLIAHLSYKFSLKRWFSFISSWVAYKLCTHIANSKECKSSKVVKLTTNYAFQFQQCKEPSLAEPFAELHATMKQAYLSLRTHTLHTCTHAAASATINLSLPTYPIFTLYTIFSCHSDVLLRRSI